MAEQKRRLAMDIVAPATSSELPTKKKSALTKLRHLRLKLPRIYAGHRATYILGAVTIIALASWVVRWQTVSHSPQLEGIHTFPANTIQEIAGFKFYYFRPGFQTDFTLLRNSINYQSGVLVFEMKNPTGKTLAFTEEATPPGYGMPNRQPNRQFYTEYGKALVIDGSTQTTGALFSQDNTWVVINAPQAIGGDLMQQLLDALSPTGS